MRLRTFTLSTFTLDAVLFFGIAANAGDLPREGSFSGTYAAYGTAKATSIGKDRVLTVFDENGLTLGDGLTDHVTWHCWGLGDFTNTTGQDHGYCVGTDLAGDQMVLNFANEKHAMDQKTNNGSFTFTTGTGKYVGITGSGTYVWDGGGFRPVAEGTFFSHNTHKGSYKLPPLTQ
jgi:hypothetical protein